MFRPMRIRAGLVGLCLHNTPSHSSAEKQGVSPLKVHFGAQRSWRGIVRVRNHTYMTNLPIVHLCIFDQMHLLPWEVVATLSVANS